MKIYSFYLLILMTSLAANAQTTKKMTPPLSHEKQVYINKDEKLFVAQSLPIYLHLSLSPDMREGSVLLKSKKFADYVNPMYLSEGINYIVNKKAVDPKTNKIIKGEGVAFDIIVDGSSPESVAQYQKADFYKDGNSVYYGKNLVFDLQCEDELSGVQERYLSVNGGEFKPLKEPISDFKKDKTYNFRFYAVDNVGNVEDYQEQIFTIDVTWSKTEYTVNGIYDWDNLSSSATIELTSEDNYSGIKTIFYQLTTLGTNRISLYFSHRQYLFNSINNLLCLIKRSKHGNLLLPPCKRIHV